MAINSTCMECGGEFHHPASEYPLRCRDCRELTVFVLKMTIPGAVEGAEIIEYWRLVFAEPVSIKTARERVDASSLIQAMRSSIYRVEVEHVPARPVPLGEMLIG